MTVAQTLAELAADAYSQNPAKDLPDGFTPVDVPGLQMHHGLYADGPAEAALFTGALDGEQVLVLAFRGSDDRTDWIDDLRDINAEYAQFQPLISAVEDYANQGGKVVVVGHSLGGAMAQVFMSAHAGDDHYRAVTFGSPGALPEGGVFAPTQDDRITNYAVSDDPFVFLGEHRAELAAFAVQHPEFATAVIAELSKWTHLSAKEVAGSLPFMTTDYANNGVTVTLPGSGAPVDIANLLTANPAEHDIGLYVSLTGSGSLFEPSLW
jgi:pimeloyl-ACP methyl ester carboxylesterase